MCSYSMLSIDFQIPTVCFAYKVPFYSDTTGVINQQRHTDSCIYTGVVNTYIQITDRSFHCFLMPGFFRLAKGTVFEYAYCETHTVQQPGHQTENNQLLRYFLPI